MKNTSKIIGIALCFLVLVFGVGYFFGGGSIEGELFSTQNTNNIYYVQQYGAQINDGIDDTVQIRNTFQAAKQTGGKVVFQNGEYTISGQQRETNDMFYKPIFTLSDYHNLVVEGNGAHFEAKNRAQLFNTVNSSNIVFKNFSVDWSEDMPFTAGVITQKTPSYVQIQVDSHHVVRESPIVEVFRKWDPVGNKPAPGGYFYNQRGSGKDCEVVGNTSIKCGLKQNYSMSVGDTIAVLFKKNKYNAFHLNQSNDITINGVTLYTTPGLGVFSSRVTNLTIDSMNIEPLPGSGRFISVTAGATNLGSIRGELVLKNNYFTNTIDDHTNIHSKYFLVDSVSGRNVTVKTLQGSKPIGKSVPHVFDQFRVGQEGDGLILEDQVYHVKSVNTSGSNTRTIQFEEQLGGTIQAGNILANVSNIPRNTKIQNNTFMNSGARGVLLATKNALVEGNTISGMSGPALQIQGDGFVHGEGPGAEGITLNNNLIDGGNDGYASKPGSITLFGNYGGANYANAGAVSDVSICNTTFTNTQKNDIFIASTDGISLKGNDYDTGIFSDPSSININTNAQTCSSYAQKNILIKESQSSDSFVFHPYSIAPSKEPILTFCNTDGFFFKRLKDSTGRTYIATKSSLDFENPGDANRDNIYEVCLQSNWGNGNINTQTVSIELINPSNNAIQGECGSTFGSCLQGQSTALSNSACGTNDTWTCLGSSGGSSDSCTLLDPCTGVPTEPSDQNSCHPQVRFQANNLGQGGTITPDFFDLFERPEDWDEVLAKIDYMTLRARAIKPNGTPTYKLTDEQIKTLSDRVQQYDLKIGLNFTGQLLPRCSNRIAIRNGERDGIQRLLDAGIPQENITIMMQSFFSKRFGKEDQTQWCTNEYDTQKIPKRVEDVVEYMKFMLNLFPEITFGGNDSGPLLGHPYTQYLAGFAQTLQQENISDAFEVFVLDNVSKDFTYGTFPRIDVKRLENLVRSYGRGFGVVLTERDGGNISDQEYQVRTLGLYSAGRDAGITFDHVLQRAWYPHPSLALPSTTNYTHTHTTKKVLEEIESYDSCSYQSHGSPGDTPPICDPIAQSIVCNGQCGSQSNGCGGIYDCGSCSSPRAECGETLGMCDQGVLYKQYDSPCGIDDTRTCVSEDKRAHVSCKKEDPCTQSQQQQQQPQLQPKMQKQRPKKRSGSLWNK